MKGSNRPDLDFMFDGTASDSYLLNMVADWADMSEWDGRIAPRLRQIAERLGARESGGRIACSYQRVDSPIRCPLPATSEMTVHGPMCKHHAAEYFGGADRMTATEVPPPPVVAYKIDCDPVTGKHRITHIRAADNSWGQPATTMQSTPAHLVPLGLAGGTATAVAVKTEAPEPCICPPGAVSRSCRAVGFRSGIMHKDRE